MNGQHLAETKDGSIRSLLRAIEAESIATKIEVADHWDADRHAIGFHRVGTSEPLLYVSTWQMPKGTYHWDLENRSGQSAEAGTAPSTKVLRELLVTYLVLDDGAPPKTGQQKRRARSA